VPETISSPSRGAAWFVWGVWTLMLLAALLLVIVYGSNIPIWDEWDMVPLLTGQQPVTPAWLWSQHNEHRVPLPRLLLLGLYFISNSDFRAGMVFNVLSMAALAASLILIAKQLRKRISYTDAFFPLILLHVGHSANFLWTWQVTQVTATVLSVLLLVIIAWQGSSPGLRTPTLAAFCLILLVLCGANGVVLVPPVLLWLVYLAAQRWRPEHAQGRRDGVLVSGLALLVLLILSLYFVGYERVPYWPFSPSPRAFLATVLQLLSVSFGRVTATRPYWHVLGLVVLSLLLLSVALLIRIVRTTPSERPRALGLLMFLVSMAGLALAIAWGRPYSRLESRYSIFLVPAPCCAYLVWSLYGPPGTGPAIRLGTFLLACIALGPNVRFGLHHATDWRSHLKSFEEDMAAGVPLHELISRHRAYLHVRDEILTDYLPMLRDAAIGQFRSLRVSENFREVAIPLVPAESNQVEWHDRTAYATGDRPYLVFALPEDVYACGIRLKFTHASPEGTLPCVSLHWRRGGQGDFHGHYDFSPIGDKMTWARGTWSRRADPEATVTYWAGDIIRELRIHPDYRPCVFRISELVLLAPATVEYSHTASTWGDGLLRSRGAHRRLATGEPLRIGERR
jgi:hypothetical protein